MRYGMAGVLLTVLVSVAVGADWYTRVERLGVKDAAAEDVALYEKGRLPASLHVGDCYYHLERFEEGVAVFRGLRREPDRNYAAAATVREAEGLVKLGKHGEARSLFAACLDEFPEAFLDVDIPELCRAWLREIASRTPAAPKDGAVEASRMREPPAGVRDEIRKLEAEIADLKKRLAELRRLLAESD